MICRVCLRRMKMFLEFVKLFSLEMKVFLVLITIRELNKNFLALFKEET